VPAAFRNAVPIVIGVTGHRDVPDDAAPVLRERFGEVVERLATRFHSTPLLLLTGLRGSTEIVLAEEALERGIGVMACLTKPAAEYERELSGERAQRVHAILDRCAAAVVDDVDRFVAYYSAALVSHGSAGTQGSADESPLFELERSGVREMYPVRRGVLEIAKQKRKFTWRRARAGEKTDPARDDFEAMLHNLDRFNCDIADEPAPQTDDLLESFQARADSASNRLQKWTLHSLTGLYVVAAIAGAAQLIVQAPVTQLWGGRLGAAGNGVRIGVLAIAFLWFRFAKRKDYENRYQDYRAVAEALRVQHAWCSAGLRDHLVENSYLQMQQSELRWIRLALRAIYLISDARTSRASDSPDCKACDSWIDDQLAYYEGAAQSQARKQHDAARLGGILAGIGGAVSGLAVILLILNGGVSLGGHLGFLGIHAQHWSLSDEWRQLNDAGAKSLVKAWATYLITVPPTLAGMLALLIGFYTQQRGFNENSRRYQRVFSVFYDARYRLRERGGDPRAILGDLGHEALSEHADWLILHRERPLRVVNVPITMQGVNQ
jgi:hypothetical protein